MENKKTSLEISANNACVTMRSNDLEQVIFVLGALKTADFSKTLFF